MKTTTEVQQERIVECYLPKNAKSVAWKDVKECMKAAVNEAYFEGYEKCEASVKEAAHPPGVYPFMTEGVIMGVEETRGTTGNMNYQVEILFEPVNINHNYNRLAIADVGIGKIAASKIFTGRVVTLFGEIEWTESNEGQWEDPGTFIIKKIVDPNEGAK